MLPELVCNVDPFEDFPPLSNPTFGNCCAPAVPATASSASVKSCFFIVLFCIKRGCTKRKVCTGLAQPRCYCFVVNYLITFLPPMMLAPFTGAAKRRPSIA